VTFIVIGILGIAVSGVLSKRYWDKANPLERMVGSAEGRAFGGAVPLWVSLINLASFGCLIYGIIKLGFLS
jgi:hypothetical protein